MPKYKVLIIVAGIIAAMFSFGSKEYRPYDNVAIAVQALTSSPTDAQTIYFGTIPRAPATNAASSKVYVRRAGVIRIAEVYCFSGTGGTAESWSLYIRVNNTTDYLISTLTLAASERIFTNSNLAVPVSEGDYFEIKGVQPTWATNPLTTHYGGYVFIDSKPK